VVDLVDARAGAGEFVEEPSGTCLVDPKGLVRGDKGGVRPTGTTVLALSAVYPRSKVSDAVHLSAAAGSAR